MLRMIATDLDGTLLRSDGSVSPRTSDALDRARAAGLHIAFVSARPPRTLALIANSLNLTGLAICSNGAILYDLEADEILTNERLPVEVAKYLIETLKRSEPTASFAAEYGHKVGYEPMFPQSWETTHIHPPLIASALELCAEEITKLMIHHPDRTADALIQDVAALVGDRATVHHSGDAFIEIHKAGVSKASALAALCKKLNLSSDEVVAFGDMPNDLPMLSFAGLGVAVANAHPDVISVADKMTLSNDEDGVAIVVEEILRGADVF